MCVYGVAYPPISQFYSRVALGPLFVILVVSVAARVSLPESHVPPRIDP